MKCGETQEREKHKTSNGGPKGGRRGAGGGAETAGACLADLEQCGCKYCLTMLLRVSC